MTVSAKTSHTIWNANSHPTLRGPADVRVDRDTVYAVCGHVYKSRTTFQVLSGLEYNVAARRTAVPNFVIRHRRLAMLGNKTIFSQPTFVA